MKKTDKIEIRNAQIVDTFLGDPDYGYITAILTLDYGDCGIQGFGTHDLKYKHYGVSYIQRILKTVGVNSWENLKGKYVRVKVVDGLANAIGHITEDKWFDPENDLIPNR